MIDKPRPKVLLFEKNSVLSDLLTRRLENRLQIVAIATPDRPLLGTSGKISGKSPEGETVTVNLPDEGIRLAVVANTEYLDLVPSLTAVGVFCLVANASGPDVVARFGDNRRVLGVYKPDWMKAFNGDREVLDSWFKLSGLAGLTDPTQEQVRQAMREEHEKMVEEFRRRAGLPQRGGSDPESDPAG